MFEVTSEQVLEQQYFNQELRTNGMSTTMRMLETRLAKRKCSGN